MINIRKCNSIIVLKCGSVRIFRFITHIKRERCRLWSMERGDVLKWNNNSIQKLFNFVEKIDYEYSS